MKLSNLQEARYHANDIKSSDIFKYIERENITHELDPDGTLDISFGTMSYDEWDNVKDIVDQIDNALSDNGGVSIEADEATWGAEDEYNVLLRLHNSRLGSHPNILRLVKRYGSDFSWDDEF